MNETNFVLNWKITAALYREAASKATRALVRNWMIPLASIVSYFLFVYLVHIFSSFPGSAGGFTPQGLILGLVIIALLALYYGWLEAAVNGQKLKIKDLISMDLGLFFAVMGVGFMLWIINLLLGMFFSTNSAQALLNALHFGIFVAFNSVCEVIYLQRKDGITALQESVLFLKDNWAEWFIPLLLLLAPAIALIRSSIFFILAQGDPLLPALVFLESLLLYLEGNFGSSIILPITIGVVVVTWFMIFRGYLFKQLSTTSKRQRLYKQHL